MKMKTRDIISCVLYVISAFTLSTIDSFSPPLQHVNPTRALFSTRQVNVNSYLKNTSSKTAYLTYDGRKNRLNMSDLAVESEESEDIPLFEKFMKGINRDYKQRLPLYGSDITDGFNTQVRIMIHCVLHD